MGLCFFQVLTLVLDPFLSSLMEGAPEVHLPLKFREKNMIPQN